MFRLICKILTELRGILKGLIELLLLGMCSSYPSITLVKVLCVLVH